MNQELVRIVDNIARDKNIDRESIFQDLEAAMVSAVRKHFGLQDVETDVEVLIDRETGEKRTASLLEFVTLGSVQAAWDAHDPR